MRNLNETSRFLARPHVYASSLTPLAIQTQRYRECPLEQEHWRHADAEDGQEKQEGLVHGEHRVEEVVERPRQHAEGEYGDDSSQRSEEPHPSVQDDAPNYATKGPTYCRQPFPQSTAPRFYGIRPQPTEYIRKRARG